MALETYKGTIVAPNTGTPPVARTVTGLPFQPKLLLFWCACTATMDTSAINAMTCFGAARTTTEQFTIASASDGNSIAAANCGRFARFGTECIGLPLNGTPAIDALATFVQFNADGFQVNFTDVAATANMEVEYLALGGSDITNAKIVEVTPNSTVNGTTQAISFGFTPDLVLTASSGVPNTAAIVDAMTCLGAAVRQPSTQQYATFWYENDAAANMDCAVYNTQSRMGSSADSTAVKDSDYSLTSWDASGITITWNDAVAATTSRQYMIGIQGGQYELKYVTAPTSTGTVNYPLGLQPKGLFAFGASDTTDTDTTVLATVVDSQIFIGGCDSVLRHGTALVTQQDANATSQSRRRQTHQKLTTWTTGTAGTLAAEANVPALSTPVGRTSAGTTADFNLSGWSSAWKFTASASKNIHKLWFNSKVANATLTAAQLAIYADNGSGTAPAARLALASADSLADAKSAGPWSATLSSPVAVTGGTVYWLVRYSIGEQQDFQGDTAGSYLELTGAPPSPWSGGTAGSTNAIIWAEEAGFSSGGFDLNWTTATAGTRKFVVVAMGETIPENPPPLVMMARTRT